MTRAAVEASACPRDLELAADPDRQFSGEASRLEHGPRHPASRDDDVTARLYARRQIVLVLGMHRSGTSAITGTMIRLGAVAPSTPVPPASDNPRGFHESARIVEINDQLLAEAGSSYDDWRDLNWKRLDPFVSEKLHAAAKLVILEEFGDSKLAAMKDPRVCRLVPFWRKALEEARYEVGVVIPIRSPVQVAASLEKRNSFPVSKGLLLWLRHVLEAEYHTRDLPRCFMRLDDFVEDWRSSLDTVKSALGIEWPRSYEEAQPDIDQFLSRDLLHHQEHHEGLSSDCEWVGEVLAALDVLVQDASDPAAQEALNRVRAELNRAEVLYSPLVTQMENWVQASVDRCHDAELSSAALLTERDAMAARIAELAAVEGRLSSELRELQIGSAATQAELDATRLRLTQTSDHLEKLTAELRAARERAEELIQRAREREEELIQRAREREEALAERARDAEEKARLVGHLEELLVERARGAEAEARLTAHLEELLVERARAAEADAGAKARLSAQLEQALAQHATDAEAKTHLIAEVEELRSRAGSAEAQAAAQLVEATRHSSQLHYTEFLLARLADELAAVKRRVVEEQETARRLAAELGRLAPAKQQLEAELKRVRGSLVWRLMHPLGTRTPPDGPANPHFDAAWYLATYADVRESGMDPYHHYLAFGAAEGRNPSATFDTTWYLEQHPDVKASGMNPLVHYWQSGEEEGRLPGPPAAGPGSESGTALVDAEWYLAKYPDVRRAGVDPVWHFRTVGHLEGRLPNPLADSP